MWHVVSRHMPLLLAVTTSLNDTPTKTPTPRLRWLRAVLPHVITACVAVALTLGIVGLWPRPGPAYVLPPTAIVGATAPEPTTQPLPPTATPLPLSAGVARQEIGDLQTEDNQLWATVYILKSVNQVLEAEGALRINDMPSVDQALIAVDYSLSLAYTRADESQKSPIDQFRRSVDRIRSDLYVYPERLDVRLAQLRQLLLTLIDEPS